jgi:paraquat-inducible protein B
MKEMVLLFLTSLVLLLMSSCENKEKEVENELYEEVMVIHDSIMPAMKDITILQKQIKQRISTLDSSSAEEYDKLLSQRERLDQAHESMMEWMRTFDKDLENRSHEEIIEYLEDRKKRIAQVGTFMRETIEATKDSLNIEEP